MEQAKMKDHRIEGTRRKLSNKQRRHPGPALLERMQPDAAGIDCGATSHFVAVPRDRDPQPVREFRTFTADLQRLAEWLVQCRIKTVALESTGVYWIPVYEILEARSIEVVLVDARDVHNVRGRKSDVQDCQWLQELHRVGLLRASFRPRWCNRGAAPSPDSDRSCGHLHSSHAKGPDPDEPAAASRAQRPDRGHWHGDCARPPGRGARPARAGGPSPRRLQGQ